jgi:hypothetical protein
MSISIERGIRERIKNPTPTEEVTLIVDLDSIDAEEVVREVEAVGDSVEVEETLPFRSIAVSLQGKDLEALCELEFVSRVELEGEGRVLNSGN